MHTNTWYELVSFIFLGRVNESAVNQAAKAMASDNGDGRGRSGVGEGGGVGGEGLGQQAPDQLSGKEVDLFYRSPNGLIHNNANGNGVRGMNPNNGDHRARNGLSLIHI